MKRPSGCLRTPWPKGVAPKLFARFDDYLIQKGYAARKGQILDATIVEVPRQRNSKEENQAIKSGEAPDWPENKRRQKNTHASWTMKHGVSHFGYKNHISTDVKHKLIRKWTVTPASVHDSQAFGDLLDKRNSGKGVWADSAYRSQDIENQIKKKHKSQIHHKGYRGHPLSEAKQRVNHERSKTRARVEHIFGFQKTSMGGSLIRGVGQVRATNRIGMRNLVYNMCRYTQLLRLKTA